MDERDPSLGLSASGALLARGTKGPIGDDDISIAVAGPTAQGQAEPMGIASLPPDILAIVLGCLVDAKDDGRRSLGDSLYACIAAHRCFRDAVHSKVFFDYAVTVWLRRGPLWACSHGNVKALQALLDRGVVYREEHLVAASECGHLDAVAFLCSHGAVGDDVAAPATCPDRADEQADSTQPPKRTALDVAAANGHIAIVRLLHNRLAGKCIATTAAMDEAAENGHLDIVMFLDRHRQEGCTTRAMDWAAYNGHAAIVAYLREHRSEGCTHWAMDAAATNGHLRVVAYLNEHRGEGCTAAAMDGAAANGHIDVGPRASVARNKVPETPPESVDDEIRVGADGRAHECP